MSQVKKSLAVFGLIVVFAIGVAVAIDKRPDSPGPGASSADLVAAARETYKGRLQQWPIDPTLVTLDEIYVWSKRWMMAEWDLNLQAGDGAKSVSAHLERMANLEKSIILASKNGSAAPADVAAAKYYRIEAELMLARAGG